MRKLIGLLAIAGVAVACAGAYSRFGTHAGLPFAWTETDAGERGPPEGDYWAIRVGYGGDPHNMRFEPTWLLNAAVQERHISTGVPAGAKNYTKSASGPALDPNQFTLLGPQPLAGEGFGAGNNAGRTNVIVVDPVDPTMAFLGSDGGGVWKTTNCCSSATTWAIKTDFPEVASISIGDITFDPNDHTIIYAGTGDLRYGSFTFGAAGVLKSIDQGETWVVLGEDVFNPFYGPSAGGFPQYQAIGKVVVDPNNSSNVIVSTKTGVFFSYDAGVDWSGPCYTNAFTTGPTPQRQDTTGLVAVNNAGTTTLYAAVGTRGFPTPVQPDLGQNGANGVYRAAMPSSGCPAVSDWTLLNNNWPAGTGNGTPNTTIGRVELAAAPSDSLTLYAMASDANNATRSVQGVYKTVDGGVTWTQVANATTFTNGGCQGAGGQMWYDSGITVSPTDPNVVFFSTVDLFRSTNGGTTLTDLTNAYCGGPVHPDNHARAFVGTDGTKILNGNDGGVYYATNALATPSWIALNNTLATIEVYHGDITANFATAANSGATGGFQDNGSASVLFTPTSPPGPSTWQSTNGGDGIVSRIEPVLARHWYYSSQNGALVVTANGPFSGASNASGGWSGDVLSFIFPFDIYRYGDTGTAGSGCDTTNGCNHLIAGSNRVWETLTGAIPASSWHAKTPNLTKNNLILGSDNRSFINNLHYAVSDPTVAIVATNDGNVQYVFALGASGTATPVNVTAANAVLPDRPIMDATTDPLNPLIGYAAVGGFNENTPATPGHILRVTCTALCASFVWEDKSGNLPDIPADAVIANPNIPNQVFAGTDWGMYYTDDITASPPTWQRFEGLPHVMIWSFSIDRGFTTLAAYTRSRGAWAWPLPMPAGGSADLAVTIAAPANAEPALQFTYTITLTNNGPDTATNVQLNSPLTTGVTLLQNSGDCTTGFPCMFASLASGATQTVTTSVCVGRTYAGPDPVPFAATVTSATTDPVAGNNNASANAALITSLFADGFDCY